MSTIDNDGTPTLAAIEAAQVAIAGSILATPLVELIRPDPLNGPRILLKAECLQPTGSFKVRGATYRISRLSAAQRSAGVVAYSTGNHAQAVARAASRAGIGATIVMSPDVPAGKIAGTRRWGARIVMADASSADRRRVAEELAARTGASLVAPYDDLDVITGQATIGVEIVRQLLADPPAVVFVPVGGGGLLAGVAAAIRQLAPKIAVIGVEPEWEDDAARSFRSGQRQRLAGPSASIADAIRVQELGVLTFPIIARLVDDIVTVTEAEIAAACRLCATEAHLIVEPGGAVGVAAALAQTGGPGSTVVAIAAGGNIDPARLVTLDHTVHSGEVYSG